MYEALVTSARGIDHVHQRGLLQRLSGVDLDRALHPLVATLGQNGAMRTSELATALALKSSTVSRHVARLEDAGLVIRTEDPGDGRASLIELSTKGHRAFDAIHAAWQRIISEILQEMDQCSNDRFARCFLDFAQRLSSY